MDSINGAVAANPQAKTVPAGQFFDIKLGAIAACQLLECRRKLAAYVVRELGKRFNDGFAVNKCIHGINITLCYNFSNFLLVIVINYAHQVDTVIQVKQNEAQD